MVKSLFIGYNISVWLLHHHVTLQIPKKQNQKQNVIKNDYLKTRHCESTQGTTVLALSAQKEGKKKKDRNEPKV